MTTEIRRSPSGKNVEVLTPDDIPSMIWLDIIPTYSSSNQNVKSSQPASLIGAVTDILMPSAGNVRQTYTRGAGFSVDSAGVVSWVGDTGDDDYAEIAVSFQGTFITTHNTTTDFYFGVRTGGSQPRLTDVKKLQNARFSVSCVGNILVAANTDFNQLAACYYGGDALNAAEVQLLSAAFVLEDTGGRYS